MPGSAVVAGGGIGGLSAAIGLERAGWRVTLLERAEALHDTDLRTGHRATEVDPRTGAVTSRDPADREGSVAGDLVVAADGADSELRGLLFFDHPGRGVAATRHPLWPSGWATAWPAASRPGCTCVRWPTYCPGPRTRPGPSRTAPSRGCAPCLPP